MEHIYIHIPFCLKRCNYCDFCSTTKLDQVDEYVKALCGEIRLLACHCERRKARSMTGLLCSVGPRNDSCLTTLYIGGGTPSVLEPYQLERVFRTLEEWGGLADDAEFMVEVNPETVTKEKLEGYKDLGVNRISVGVQSFLDSELKYLGRIHGAKRAIEAVETAQTIFENVGLDLIYSLPHQTTEDIEKSLRLAAELAPKHISAYELTFEEGTKIYPDSALVKDEGENYLFVKQFLEKEGYNQYEISNYARTGFESRHNLAYWSDESYLGFGLGAHGYVKGDGVFGKNSPVIPSNSGESPGKTLEIPQPVLLALDDRSFRYANTSDLTRYLNGEYLESVEEAQEIDKLIMGLRKNSGIEIGKFPVQYLKKTEDLITSGLLKKSKTHIYFTEEGRLLSNKILLELSS